MKILLAEMEQICRPCAERMKKKNLIAVRIEEGQIDKLLAFGDIGKAEAGRLRTAMKKEGVKYFEDLPEEIQDVIFEGLKRDLINDGDMADEGVDVTNEDAVNDYVGSYINKNNDPGSNMQWLEAYWWNSETSTKLPEHWKNEDWYKGKMAMTKEGSKQLVATSGFRGKSMFGVTEIRGEICPDCKKDMLEKGMCGKCGYGYKKAQVSKPRKFKKGDRVKYVEVGPDGGFTGVLFGTVSHYIDNILVWVNWDNSGYGGTMQESRLEHIDADKTAQKEGEWPGMPEGSKEKWDKYVERKEEGTPGALPKEQKSLPTGYKKPPMEPKQFTGEESVQRLFDRAEELTELVDKAQELADRAAERMARKKGLEENRAKLEDAWKQIRKIIKDQPGRISEFRDRIYYLFAQRMRGRPSYKEMIYGPPKEGQPEYDPGQEWQGIIEKFDDKEGTISAHVKSLHATIGAMKEVYEMYVAEKQTWKKGQVGTLEAPVAEEDTVPSNEAEFIDQLTGYSYDILDIVSNTDDIMYLLDFDISELEDSIGNNNDTNNQEEEPEIPDRAPEPIAEPAPDTAPEVSALVTNYNKNVVEDAIDLPAAPKRK